MEDSNEIWLPIKGYEGLYQVSNMGHVRSLDRVVEFKDGRRQFYRGRVLKPRKNWQGYLSVTLSKDGCWTDKRVNRLVADAFVENPDPEKYDQVNHIDEDKSNNVWTNLEWCDRKYNCNFGTAIERRVEKQSKAVVAFNTFGILVHRFASVSEAGRNGFDKGAVSACCNGKRKTFKGLRWRFIHSSEA